ncbi:DUF948 domain-containing protein [Rhabdothermincola sp.]|uniref:DUF948 domain-containing protein n=1 Tax=Rhabdothermincola sp. TaxID=2820405 RepID=UPI002FE13EDF
MSAGDLAAVLVAMGVFAALVVLLYATQSLLRTMRDLRASVELLHRETIPLLEELRGTVREAGAEVDRVDHLLEAAESISVTVDSASRLGYLAFRAPLIRFVAFFKGLGRFARRLVGRPGARGPGRSRARARRGHRRAA